MPLNTHASHAGRNYGGSPLVATLENHWTTYRPFWFLLWGGVLERHPKLQLCFTESGGLQALWFNDYFDHYLSIYRRPDQVKAAITMKPSEYWYRQCYVGASAHSTRQEILQRDKIGVNNIMWGSDYPHPEGTWPASIERTHDMFHDIPERDVVQMVGGNAARVYGFDIDQMQKVAARIGPKIADISGPLKKAVA